VQLVARDGVELELALRLARGEELVTRAKQLLR
jgi:hypothetical protein